MQTISEEIEGRKQMIKSKIIYPQTCDMGSDYEIYEFDQPTSLRTVLNYIENSLRLWGTITIFYADGKIYKKFDFDTYHKDKEFYIKPDWTFNKKVVAMSSHSCFMSSNIEIRLGKEDIQ